MISSATKDRLAPRSAAISGVSAVTGMNRRVRRSAARRRRSPTRSSPCRTTSRYPHPGLPDQFLRAGCEMGQDQATATKQISPRRWCRFRSATFLFRLGADKRGDATRSFRLSSGDSLVSAGQARFAFLRVDRIYPGTSTLLAEGGRIDLTMRRVTRPAYSRTGRSKAVPP